MIRPLLAILALAALVGACTDDTSSADDPVQREVDIYSAVIRSVASQDRPDLAADTPDVVVFVAPRDDAEISLDVQLGVVLDLEEWATIRFIDEFEEAILTSEPNQPVRDDGVLINLGGIPEGTTEVRVVADRYQQADELLAFDLVVRRRAGEWSVVEPIDSTRVTVH